MAPRSFTREFKLEAVGLVSKRGLSVAQAARDLGMSYVNGFGTIGKIQPMPFLGLGR